MYFKTKGLEDSRSTVSYIGAALQSIAKYSSGICPIGEIM